jgi:antirestriction protein ArdC
MSDKLKVAHDKLQSAVEKIVSGDDWKRMLKVASKFHQYSSNNHLMIFLQRPDATLVAGFQKWKSMDRSVKKGEKGIAIFAPCAYKTKVEDDQANEKTFKQARGFRVVHVFDISQTEGEELPDMDAIRPKLLDGEAPEGIWDALVSQASAAGFDVVRKQRGGENG